MIIYLSQGTQTTFSVQIGEALYFLRASAPVCVVCVLLILCAKFPFPTKEFSETSFSIKSMRRDTCQWCCYLSLFAV